MKTTFAAAATAILAFGSSAIAQQTQSRAFFLTVYSHDKAYNNSQLQACHEGAGLEALCLSAPNAPRNASSGYSTYFFNTTQGTQTGTGTLVYDLTVNGGSSVESEPMSLFHDISTNVALPLFEPGYNTQPVGFDAKNKMYLSSALDDTVNPPTDTTNRNFYHWYTCKTNFEGYVYQTLAWVDGIQKPQNPSCCKVDVVREFVN